MHTGDNWLHRIFAIPFIFMSSAGCSSSLDCCDRGVTSRVGGFDEAMKILVAHNRYQQRGGEDFVFENELKLLTTSGYEVETLVFSNETITSHLDKALTMFRTASNPIGIAAMTQAIQRFRPDLVHVHNFFPLLSPAIYAVCNNAGIPVVQSLHNFRPFCANGRLP